MSKRNKILNKLKIIIILVSISFISLSLLFLFIFLIKDIPIISIFVKDYVKGRKSLFLPFIPNYNLIKYIPENLPPIRYTIGHLMDTIIIINLYFYLETSVYHYIKRAYIKEDDLIYVGTPALNDIDFVKVFDNPYSENQEVQGEPWEYPYQKLKVYNIKDEKENSCEFIGAFLNQSEIYNNLNNPILLLQNNNFFLRINPVLFIPLFSTSSLKYPYPFSLS